MVQRAGHCVILSAQTKKKKSSCWMPAFAGRHKPFSVQELMARIRARCASISMRQLNRRFDDGALKIDFARRQVFLRQRLISLTRRNTSC